MAWNVPDQPEQHDARGDAFMHYHPFRDLLWLPLLLSFLTSLLGIPLTLGTAALTNALPNIFGSGGGG